MTSDTVAYFRESFKIKILPTPKFKKMKKLIGLLLLLSTAHSYGEIWLPSILSDNMVLQQDSNVVIWGWTTSTSEDITVYGTWNNEKVTTKAFQGVWSLQLPTPKAGGTYSLIVEGHEKL